MQATINFEYAILVSVAVFGEGEYWSRSHFKPGVWGGSGRGLYTERSDLKPEFGVGVVDVCGPIDWSQINGDECGSDSVRSRSINLNC